MQHQGGGCIVTVCSLACVARIEKILVMFAHISEKHGVVVSIVALASEVRPLGIRVN